MDHYLIEAIGYGGTACTIASYSMRTIVPLRILGILSSFFFIIYGILIQSWPMVVTEFVILPLNLIRLVQMLRMMREVEEAADGDLSIEWLKPFARRRRCQAGETLFLAGDKAEYLLMIETGRFRLKEAEISLGAGEIVGELGYLSPGNLRTMSLECVEAGTVSEVSYRDIKHLHFSNPRFGFYFLRLISERLFQNIERARQEAKAA